MGLLPLWRKISPVGQWILRFLLCFSSFSPLFYLYGQFYFFKTSKKQEFVAFLTSFCVIWISCKFIELFQERKSNLFPDFFFDLGNPVSNLEVQEINLYWTKMRILHFCRLEIWIPLKKLFLKNFRCNHWHYIKTVLYLHCQMKPPRLHQWTF